MSNVQYSTHSCSRHETALVWVTETRLICIECYDEKEDRIQKHNARLQGQINEERRLRSCAQKVIGKLMTRLPLVDLLIEKVNGELKDLMRRETKL